MMGVCFECMVDVNGRPNQQACLITPEDGMEVTTMQAAPSVLDAQEAKHV
jgi:predicted molibdopterin-dependent oxidoreductase YjgC